MKTTWILVLDYADADPGGLALALGLRGVRATTGGLDDVFKPGARAADLLLVTLTPGDPVRLPAQHNDELRTRYPVVALLAPPKSPDIEAAYLQSRPRGLVIRAPDPDILGSFFSLALTQRQSAMELEQTRTWLDTVFQGFDGFIHLCSQDRTVEYVNERLKARTGYDGVGQPCYKVLHDRDSVCDFCVNDRVFAGETVRLTTQSPKDGRWFSVVNLPIRHADGRVSKLAMAVDISDYKEIQNNLLAAKEKYQGIVDNAMEGIFQSTPEGRFLEANPAVARILGYESPQELVRVVTSIARQVYVDPDKRKEFWAEMRAGRPVPGFEAEFYRKDGTRCWGFLAARPVFGPDGTLAYCEGILMDITARKRAEDKVRSLTREVLRAHETDRARISRDLHDQVAQDLSSLKILLETAVERFAGDPAELASRLDAAAGRLGECVSTVRGLAYDLRPPALDQLGLSGALSQFLQEFSRRTGLAVEFTSAGMDGAQLGEEAEINLYRLVREALWNVFKHAQAGKAVVRLVAAPPSVILRIEDDGRGFDVQGAERSADARVSLGLMSMRERAAHIGAKMAIRSKPGLGTRIKVEIPFTKEDP